MCIRDSTKRGTPTLHSPTPKDEFINWFAVDEKGEPSRANQIVLGYEQFIGRGLKVQIEGFYKNITDMLTYEEKRSTADGGVESESLIDLLTPADGYAYGLELFAQQSVGKLSGWAGYSWSVSRKKMNGKELMRF